MPRAARQKSSSGIYHVVLRGINQQQIFVEDEDYNKFLEIIADCRKKSGFRLYGYCLMSNRIHLLIAVVKEELSQIFKRIGTRYAQWYNRKCNRAGHLFQDRYKSEPVESDEYFLAVLRYIHQRPVKAGLVGSVEAYRWSSYGEYVYRNHLVDALDFIIEMGLDEFIRYSNEANSDTFLEDIVPRINDRDAKDVITKVSNCDTAEEFQQLDAITRSQYVKELREGGLSIRQISRLTGIGKGIIERA